MGRGGGKGGIIAGAVGTSLVGLVGQVKGSETLFSALVMHKICLREVDKKKCDLKRKAFRCVQVLISEVLLI